MHFYGDAEFSYSYLIGAAIGSVFFPPFSESFGRKSLYISSTFLYAVFCVIVGAVRSLPAVVAGRFFSGILSAIPAAVVAGSIEDLFDARGRIWMIFAWITTANLGLVAGPIISTYICASQQLGWRWVFYLAAIVSGAIACLLFGIRESRPSQLLERKMATVRQETGDVTLKIKNPDLVPDVRTYIRVTLIRPLRLFMTEPIILMTATMCAMAFGLIYLFAEALPVVYSSFDFSERQASLAFIPIGIGITSGFLPRLYDDRKTAKLHLQGVQIQPEDKLSGFYVAAPVLAIGLWWFSWVIPPLVHVHWISSLLALVLVGFALNEFDCTLTGYVADSYTIYAASGFACLSLLRSLVSAAFPLFGHQMYTKVSANAASSILAGVATIFCMSTYVFMRFGKFYVSGARLHGIVCKCVSRMVWIMTRKRAVSCCRRLPHRFEVLRSQLTSPGKHIRLRCDGGKMCKGFTA